MELHTSGTISVYKIRNWLGNNCVKLLRWTEESQDSFMWFERINFNCETDTNPKRSENWRYAQLLVILFHKSFWTWDACFAFASSAVCVPGSKGFVKQYTSSITRCFAKRLQFRPIKKSENIERYECASLKRLGDCNNDTGGIEFSMAQQLWKLITLNNISLSFYRVCRVVLGTRILHALGNVCFV